MNEQITEDEFDAIVIEFSKTNPVMKSMYDHGKTWRDLPAHLKQDLYTRVGYRAITVFEKIGD